MGTAMMELRQRSHLTLTPRLQQSVRLLQLSSLEFAQELRQAMATNPFLEEVEEEQDSEVHVAHLVADDASSRIVDETLPSDTLTEEKLSEYIEQYSESHGEVSGSKAHEDEADWTEWTEATPSLRDHLQEQLRLFNLPARDRGLCQLLIEALDDDGYLRQTFAELRALVQVDPPVEEIEWLAALKLVQSLEPAGIGARDLRECLLCQLPEPSECTEDQALARRVIKDHLQILARRDLTRLGRWLAVGEEQVRNVCQIIRRLDPHPGWRFGKPDIRYIVPDVIVRKVKGKWVTSINPALRPRIGVNRLYAKLFQNHRNAAHAQLAGQLQEARWLIRSAEQRFCTIQTVAESIVAKQRAYLEYGELAMKPLGLRHIAEELGLHESTVSRVTSNKYMATPRGLIEFRHFFSRELKTHTGGTCSATAIRALIKEMIGAEELGTPWSDAQLAQMLGGQGIQVARRTVTKYRRLLQLPSVEMRRQEMRHPLA